MGYIKNKPEIEDYLEGKEKTGTELDLPGSTMTTAPDPAPGAVTSVTTAEAPAAPTPAGTGRAVFGGSSLADLGGTLGRLSARSGDVVRGFYEEAGPRRQWGAPMERTVERAISTDPSVERLSAGIGRFLMPRHVARAMFRTSPGETMEAAQGLVGAQYTGPAGLQTEDVGEIRTGLEGLKETAEPLSRGQGLQLFTQEKYPTLTPGEARFQARAEAPEIREEARDVALGARRGLADLLEEETQAAEYAAARASAERTISEQAQALAEKRAVGLEGELEGRAKEAGEHAQKTEDAWTKYLETGDFSELKGVVTPEALEDLGKFNFGVSERQHAAEQQRGLIMGDPRYAEIENIPLGRLHMSKKGQPQIMVNIGGEEYWLRRLLRGTNVIPGMTKAESMRLANLIDERQTRMERYFSPTTARTQNYLGMGNVQQTGSSRVLENLPYFQEQGGRGLYADVLPMYEDVFAPAPMLEATDPTQYLEYTQGAIPTAENVATAAEAAELNRIYDILGLGADFTRSERATPAISVRPGGAEQFNLDELSRYRAATDALMAAEQQRREAVQAQHRRYEASKQGWMKPLGVAVAPFFGGLGLTGALYGLHGEGVAGVEPSVRPELIEDVALP